MPALLDAARFAATGDPVALARATGRSWWSLRYTDGTIRSEWERGADWLLLPRNGRQRVRLYCPNGQVAELGADGDGTGRFVQLKVAVATLGQGRGTLAHMVGYVYGLNGEMTCCAWCYRTRRLLSFIDNAYACAWEQLGPLCADHLGLAPA